MKTFDTVPVLRYLSSSVALSLPHHDRLAHCRAEFPKDEDPQWHGRHVLFEYVMLHGINDHVEHAEELVRLIKGVECKVNLIVFNPHEGTPFSASSREAVQAFRCVLLRRCDFKDNTPDFKENTPDCKENVEKGACESNCLTIP
jgi:adenine C2-methylase RlmN of 23S rRNA A2503 and tRNA A37